LGAAALTAGGGVPPFSTTKNLLSVNLGAHVHAVALVSLVWEAL
jgi:hypothetical protein